MIQYRTRMEINLKLPFSGVVKKRKDMYLSTVSDALKEALLSQEPKEPLQELLIKYKKSPLMVTVFVTTYSMSLTVQSLNHHLPIKLNQKLIMRISGHWRQIAFLMPSKIWQLDIKRNLKLLQNF